MSDISQGKDGSSAPQPSAGPPADQPEVQPHRREEVHSVSFITYPKLLFVWPIILLGLIFYPVGAPDRVSGLPGQAQLEGAAAIDAPVPAAPMPAAAGSSHRLEILGWIYLWVVVVVLLTLGVDIDRNLAAFWVILVLALYFLGVWLRDTKGFTFFGDIYRWFADLDLQYDRRFGLGLSIILLVPYVLMLLWARLNDRWRITHNEFEHYAFGRMNDSLGRGAKTIRTDFPDVFELLLGLAGTLIVYNATGTRELRRIPHVMFLPFVRKRLNRILERTAITAAESEDEDDEEHV